MYLNIFLICEYISEMWNICVISIVMDVFIVYGNVRTYACQFKELLMSYNTLHKIIIMYMHTHNVREILNWYYTMLDH